MFIHGGAVTLGTALAERVPAFVDAGYVSARLSRSCVCALQSSLTTTPCVQPGQAGGEAVAAVLYGEHSPNARLPYTLYADDFAAQRPNPSDHWLDSPPFGLTYMYWRGTPPLWSFGHGLSYSDVAHSFDAQRVHMAVREGDEEAEVRMTVRRASAETDGFHGAVAKFSALLFCRFLGPELGEGVASQPLRKLVAFEKVALRHGESRAVVLRPSLMRGLAAVREDGAYVLRAGEYELTSPGAGGGGEAAARLALAGGRGEAAGAALRVDAYLPAARQREAEAAGV